MQTVLPIGSESSPPLTLTSGKKHLDNAFPGGDPAVLMQLKDVGLDIPVYTTETRTLKSSLIRSVTGGKLSRRRGGAVITALHKVSCTVREGERIALIGHNGAGKTTFLRLISGIYRHTTGTFESRVSVYPMLHKSFITSPDLSGLQAIKAHYLMVKGNLRNFEQFSEDVIGFSGLGDFIHLPVKTYSQGMSTRLLFAVLTACRHECLALDEGLGAGDSVFFEKAQQRLHDFLSTTGTVFIASHSDSLLRSFCNRGLVFEEGRVVFDGSLQSALDYYHQGN